MSYSLSAGVYYLDVGTGSMLVQLVVAGVAGGLVFAKLWWSKITNPFRRKQADHGAVTTTETESQHARQPQRAAHDD